jgi:RNA polymerase sigma-70 factor (ECF subfamily)
MKRPDQESNWLRADEMLLEVYKQMLVVAYAKMRNRADALDVVQESWIKILTNHHHLKDPDKVIQWAKTIVANTANNVIRRRMNYARKLRTLAGQMGSMTERAHAVDYELEWNELRERVNALDEQTQRILMYKFYYGWKDREIAAALECPVGTVKAKIHRGKKLLKSRYDARIP